MSPRRVTALWFTLFAPLWLGLAGCPARNATSPPKSNIVSHDLRSPDSARDPTDQTWERIKDFGFAQRIDFAGGLARLQDDRQSAFDRLNAHVRGTPAADDPARQRQVEEFKAARIALRLDVARLGVCTAATWAAGRSQVAASWRRLQQAWHDLQVA